MKTCPNCGTKTNDPAKKCIRCGHVYSPASYKKQSDAQAGKLCPRCSNIVSQNAQQCPKCLYIFALEADKYFGGSSVKLIRSGLPIINEYNDEFGKAPIEEVFRFAAEGNTTALYELASRYRLGEDGAEKDLVKAIGLYKEVLKRQNNISAFYHVGYLLSDGICGEDKVWEGLLYLEAACRLGDTGAAVQLGIQYEYGEYLSKDYDMALKYYYFAINHGGDDAWYNAGEVYFKQGKFIKAKDCYEKALSNYAEMAAVRLGEFYEFGTADGITKDLKKALFYYETAYKNRADDNLDTNAAYYLGRFLFYEKDGSGNGQRAFRLLQEDAALGNNRSNLYLGYYYGVGIDGFLPINCERAFSCLDNVHESQKGEALYYKGVISFNTLHDVERTKAFLSMAVKEGFEEAKRMLNSINKSNQSGTHLSKEEEAEALKRAAESCSSPGAMIRYSQILLDSGKLHEAVELIKKARAHFPDNLDVILSYVLIENIHIYCGYKVAGSDNINRDDCNEVLCLISLLKAQNYEVESIKNAEIQMLFFLGRSYYRDDNEKRALNYFVKTDIRLFPFAAVLTALIHFDNRKLYNNQLYSDAKKLKSVLNSKNWENKAQQAAAYFLLSLIYATGAPNLPKDEKYAFSCIKQCNALDPEMAKDEIKKYKTGFWGNIVYKP